MDKPICKLIGHDGNVFAIIGRVCKTLRDAGLDDKETEFHERAFASDSDDDVLRLCMEYVDVE